MNDADAPDDDAPAPVRLSRPSGLGRLTRIWGRVELRVERLRARSAAADVIVTTFRRYSENDAGSYSAALTYYTFFAIFPLLLFVGAVVGYLTFLNADLRDDLYSHALSSVPLVRDVLSADTLDLLERRRQELALTGLVLSLYTGSGAIVALGHALNRINRVADEPNFVAKRLASLKWLALLGLGAVLSLGLTTVSRFAEGIFGKDTAVDNVVAIFGFAGAFCVNVAIFSTAFKVLPATTLSWREVLPGAIVAGVGFELLKSLGAAYLAQGESARSATFGTLAGAAGLLLAAFLVSQVVLWSAEVNAVLAERRATRSPPGR